MLNKLYITSHLTSPSSFLYDVHDLVNRAIDEKAVSDAPSRNALVKLASNLQRAMAVVGVISKEVGEDAIDETVVAQNPSEQEQHQRQRRSDNSSEQTPFLDETEHEGNVEEEEGEQERQGEEEKVDDKEETEAEEESGLKDSLIDELLADDEEEL